MLEFISNPWEVVETDFPAQGSPDEQLCFLLNYAVLAPSRMNTQPWLFRIDGRTVELHPDRSKRLPAVDADDRELTISFAAALENLFIAMRYFGYAPNVEIDLHSDQPDLLARVSLDRGVEATEGGPAFQSLQRLFILGDFARAGRKGRDYPKFRRIASRVHDGHRFPFFNHAPGKKHRGIGVCGTIRLLGSDIFRDGHGFSGQLRFIDLQILSGEEFTISRNDVAFFQENDISRDQERFIKQKKFPIPFHQDSLPDQGGKLFNRPLRFIFLKKSKACVDQENDSDNHLIRNVLEEKTERAGKHQQVDERAFQLPAKNAQSCILAFLQHIRPIRDTTCICLALTQSLFRGIRCTSTFVAGSNSKSCLSMFLSP